MAMRKTINVTVVVIAVVAILMMTNVLARAPNPANVKGVNIGLYQDSSCTLPLTSISWGLLEPGASYNKTFFVKNEGKAALNLSMTSNGWNPVAAEGYISLTWNCEGTPVAARKNVPAVLTLMVFANATGISDFSSDVIVTGTG